MLLTYVTVGHGRACRASEQLGEKGFEVDSWFHDFVYIRTALRFFLRFSFFQLYSLFPSFFVFLSHAFYLSNNHLLLDYIFSLFTVFQCKSSIV